MWGFVIGLCLGMPVSAAIQARPDPLRIRWATLVMSSVPAIAVGWTLLHTQIARTTVLSEWSWRVQALSTFLVVGILVIGAVVRRNRRHREFASLLAIALVNALVLFWAGLIGSMSLTHTWL